MNTYRIALLLVLLVFVLTHCAEEQTDTSVPTPTLTEDGELIINGIHEETGLVYAEGFDLVRSNCTNCHSARLITQQRATAAGWSEMIRWMQQKQGLHDLGDNETAIVAYLAQHYAPEDSGRRPALDLESVEWYELK